MWMMSVPMPTCTVTGMLEPCGRREQAEIARCGGDVCRSHAPTAWPMPSPRADAFVDGGVQLRPGFLRHAEAAGPERFVDVLGGRAGQRELEVVDDAGAVGRERRDEAALHQVDEHRRQAGLDHVRAETPDDAAIVAPRRAQRRARPP